jgi:hypothetical protein
MATQIVMDATEVDGSWRQKPGRSILIGNW